MNLPFKGSLNKWYHWDGRVYPVNKLSDEILVEIFSKLREVAQEELTHDNPYRNKPNPQPLNDDGTPYFSPHELELWILENCITYPALKNQAVIRNLWDREQRIAKLPEETNQIRFAIPTQVHVEILEKKVKYLTEKVASFEKEAAYWKERVDLYKRAIDEIREAVAKYEASK